MKENKLIAEFMGYTLDNEELNSFRIMNKNRFKYIRLSNMKYHTDWNCLMPVVEKCYNTKESYNLHKDIEDAFIYDIENRIQAVYLSVVDFIKSYNEAMGQESVYSIRDTNIKTRTYESNKRD